MSISIYIVGCGGIGSALFQDLVRSRIMIDKNIRIVLIDGDRVEHKNIGRQHFSLSQIGKFKAEALAETATKVLNLNNVYFVNKYILSPQDLILLTDNFDVLSIIVGCVDNHVARLCLENFVRTRDKYLYYIDCSNGINSGEVVAVRKMYNKIYGAFRSEYDPTVLTDKTDEKKIEFENTVNCSNEIDNGNEQTIIANRKAAIIALEYISNCLTSTEFPKAGISFFKECVIGHGE